MFTDAQFCVSFWKSQRQRDTLLLRLWLNYFVSRARFVFFSCRFSLMKQKATTNIQREDLRLTEFSWHEKTFLRSSFKKCFVREATVIMKSRGFLTYVPKHNNFAFRGLLQGGLKIDSRHSLSSEDSRITFRFREKMMRSTMKIKRNGTVPRDRRLCFH